MAKMTKRAWIKKVEAKFKETNPEWKPEHGDDEIRNVIDYLLSANGDPFMDGVKFNTRISIKSAADVVANFISAPLD